MKRILASLLVVGLVAAPFFASPAVAEEGGDSMVAKLQAMVADLSVEQQAALYLLLSELRQGGAEAPAAQEISMVDLVNQEVGKLAEALSGGDLDTTMKFFSEDFSHYQFGNKQGMKDFLQQAADMGYLEDIELNTADMKVEEKDGEVTIYPVEAEGYFGSATLEFVLKQEDGEWRVISLDAQGI
jgi:ketosteroid isomerase-like protein